MPFPATPLILAALLVLETPCTTLEEAKAVAECDTLGEAVTARKTLQTDGTKGWEVLVHMPGKKRGWRCIIDWDLGKVRLKDSIPNPPSRTHCPRSA
ncbi:hypothetical protein [Mesoterricola silvestris]|uniref:Uncharacterized protein n=1 Tax=Mesoterricola silvestris TaxID=2927979 RepID=A0AA48KAA0_9BACT|nr:hypothetical protein [Mesoterricola silvestris]BDU73895.1 hypothetical protein METEAL_30690 [Mesoterricola silvestris]